MATFTSSKQSAGELLRRWRKRRRLSQLDLAMNAEISQRHLSFIESGRSQPSREMLLRLAESLAIPLRDRNLLLASAGFAPVYPERSFGETDLELARGIVAQILNGHEPNPALAVDRHWVLLMANNALVGLTQGARPDLLQEPVNVLRLSLHPSGLAPRILNFEEWRDHVLARLRQQIEMTSDLVLANLYQELKSYPTPLGSRAYIASSRSQYADLAIPLVLDSPVGELRFLSTTTVFGTPVDISLSELAIEAFFPMDENTASAMRKLASDHGR